MVLGLEWKLFALYPLISMKTISLVFLALAAMMSCIGSRPQTGASQLGLLSRRFKVNVPWFLGIV